MRVPPSARISPRPGPGQVCLLILLDDAAAAGSLQAAAQLAGLAATGEGPDHGAEIDALGAEIDPVDQRLLAAELARILGLQAVERGLRVGLATLRRDLHRVAAAGCCRRRCRRGPPRGCGSGRRGAR